MNYDLWFRYANANFCFVSISEDLEKQSWLDKLSGSRLQNNYLILIPRQSAIDKHFGIIDIPRYILYDKSGKLISADAPRPSDKALQELIKKNL